MPEPPAVVLGDVAVQPHTVSADTEHAVVTVADVEQAEHEMHWPLEDE